MDQSLHGTFPGGSDSKASVYNVKDLGSIPGLGRFPGEGNGNRLQYSCLENPMDRGAWCRLLSMGSKELGTTERLHFYFHFHHYLHYLHHSLCSGQTTAREHSPIKRKLD